MGNCFCHKDTDSDLELCTVENTENFTLCGKSMKVKVLDVYDGDTITVAFNLEKKFYKKRCRIYGIDCPEIKTKNLEEKSKGLEVRDYVKKLILGKILTIDFVDREDKYGRLLGIVYLKDNKEDRLDFKLIEKGYGKPYFGGKKY